PGDIVQSVLDCCQSIDVCDPPYIRAIVEHGLDGAVQRALGNLEAALTPPKQKLTVNEEIARGIEDATRLFYRLPEYYERIIESMERLGMEPPSFEELLEIQVLDLHNWALDRDGKPNVVRNSMVEAVAEFRGALAGLYAGVLEDMRVQAPEGSETRQWVEFIQQRLPALSTNVQDDPGNLERYKTRADLFADLAMLKEAAEREGIAFAKFRNPETGVESRFTQLQALRLAPVNFGMHFSKCETRQNGKVHAVIMNEIYEALIAAGALPANTPKMDFSENNSDMGTKVRAMSQLLELVRNDQAQPELRRIIARRMEERRAEGNPLSGDAKVFVDNMECISYAADHSRAIPSYIIADCTEVDPLIAQFLLMATAEDTTKLRNNPTKVIPLLESRETLEQSDRIVKTCMSNLVYLEYARGNLVMMFAGSDSTRNLGPGTTPLRLQSMERAEAALKEVREEMLRSLPGRKLDDEGYVRGSRLTPDRLHTLAERMRIEDYDGVGSAVGRNHRLSAHAMVGGRTDQGRLPGRPLEHAPVDRWEQLLTVLMEPAHALTELPDGISRENLGNVLHMPGETPAQDAELADRFGRIATRYETLAFQGDALLTCGTPFAFVAAQNFSARPNMRSGNGTAKVAIATQHLEGYRAIGYNGVQIASGLNYLLTYGLAEDNAERGLPTTPKEQDAVLVSAFGALVQNLLLARGYLGLTRNDAERTVTTPTDVTLHLEPIERLGNVGCFAPHAVLGHPTLARDKEAREHAALLVDAYLPLDRLRDAARQCEAASAQNGTGELAKHLRVMEQAAANGNAKAYLTALEGIMEYARDHYQADMKIVPDLSNPNLVVYLLDVVQNAAAKDGMTAERGALIKVLVASMEATAVIEQCAIEAEMARALPVLYSRLGGKVEEGQRVEPKDLLNVLPALMRQELTDDLSLADPARQVLLQLHQEVKDGARIDEQMLKELVWRTYFIINESIAERAPVSFRHPAEALSYEAAHPDFQQRVAASGRSGETLSLRS
ncbi:MAG: phosphoenolpyruvate carboxylase, partial [Alphaproteobacteria bacterium]|nr:phosphoenolpyruvate carboxylase [Alphaproteobacteria bacterium]